MIDYLSTNQTWNKQLNYCTNSKINADHGGIDALTEFWANTELKDEETN